jgi:ribosomal protein S12 methylthiotransferase
MKGLHRSKPRALIFREDEQLLRGGVREVVLIGQDTTRYGRDLGEPEGLASLLAELCDRFPELPWLRVMYAYPRHVTQAFLDVMRERPQVCRYLDLPLQHLHPETLRRMRRPHRDVEEVVGWIRSSVPGIALRTTFIVGFPGETEAEFEYLCQATAGLRFDRVGVFTYSDEEGTPAYEFADRVPRKVKVSRRARLMGLARKLSLARNRELVGADIDVLVEGRGDGASELSVGRSYRDAPEVDGVVLIEGAAAPGEMVRVRVQRALEYDLVGVPTAPSSGADPVAALLLPAR